MGMSQYHRGEAGVARANAQRDYLLQHGSTSAAVEIDTVDGQVWGARVSVADNDPTGRTFMMRYALGNS